MPQDTIFFLKQKALKSVKWTAFGEVFGLLIQPAITLALAKILSPQDFGVVGIAAMVIGLSQIFLDLGLGKTLIQRKGEITDAANVIFWTNLVMAVGLYCSIFLSAPSLAAFFKADGAVNVLRVMPLQAVLFSLLSVHQALLQRAFEFRKLFVIRFSSTVLPGIISVVLALAGMGVWALVWGTLMGGMIQLALVWTFSHWRPSWQYNMGVARELLSFSKWVIGEAFLGWAIMYGDLIALGHYMGVRDLGVYRVGTLFVAFMFGIFFNPLSPVVYSFFSRSKGVMDSHKISRTFLDMAKVISIVAMFLGVGAMVLSYKISVVLFGHRWENIQVVITFISATYTIGWLVGVNPEVIRAVGRPDLNTKLLGIAFLYYIPVYIFAAREGLFVFCAARLAVAAVGIFLHFYVAHKVLGVPFLYIRQCLGTPLAAGVCMALALRGILALNVSVPRGITEILYLLFTAAAGAAVYFAVVWFKDREWLAGFAKTIKGVIK